MSVGSDNNYDADVAIVGSGVAGALCAYKLAQKGLKVIILEAGPRVNRSTIVEGFKSTYKQDLSAGYPNSKLAPRPDWSKEDDDYLIQEGSWPLKTEYLRVVGGTTWHWAGIAMRLTPNEFRMKSTLGIGKDWPISYETLEPYYVDAEREMGVSGDPNDDFGAPRSAPYPLPPVELGYLEKILMAKLEPHGIKFVQQPMVKSSQSTEDRPRCHGYNSCNPICPIGAMYNGIEHVEKAEKLGVKVLEEALVTSLDVNEKRDISAVHIQRPDGSKEKVQARTYVLAANGLETPRILLLSANEKMPSGVANSSDQVGRNLMDHPGNNVRMELKFPVFPGRGPESLVTTYQFRDTPNRKTRSAFYLSMYNQVPVHAIALKHIEKGLMGKALDQAIRKSVVNSVSFASVMEQLPDKNNRVRLDPKLKDSAGLAKIKISYQLDEYVRNGLVDLENIYNQIGERLDVKNLEITPHFSHNHLMGTLSMGNDERFSVTDGECRTHDHKNLFIASSAVFPTSGAVAPTLTIAALSIRLADTIQAQLRKS
jgi:choline dehydrogenase-like flavoprotein